ncbi:hypothetical protein WA158_002852 [Blastocystis sp. Blastoise]
MSERKSMSIRQRLVENSSSPAVTPVSQKKNSQRSNVLSFFLITCIVCDQLYLRFASNEFTYFFSNQLGSFGESAITTISTISLLVLSLYPILVYFMLNKYREDIIHISCLCGYFLVTFLECFTNKAWLFMVERILVTLFISPILFILFIRLIDSVSISMKSSSFLFLYFVPLSFFLSILFGYSIGEYFDFHWYFYLECILILIYLLWTIMENRKLSKNILKVTSLSPTSCFSNLFNNSLLLYIIFGSIFLLAYIMSISNYLATFLHNSFESCNQYCASSIFPVVIILSSIVGIPLGVTICKKKHSSSSTSLPFIVFIELFLIISFICESTKIFYSLIYYVSIILLGALLLPSIYSLCQYYILQIHTYTTTGPYYITFGIIQTLLVFSMLLWLFAIVLVKLSQKERTPTETDDTIDISLDTIIKGQYQRT